MDWKNELEELEQLLNTLMEAPVNERGMPQRRQDTKNHKVVLELVTVAKQNINKVAFGFRKPKHRVLYIQRHQRALVRLMDMVFLESPALKGTPFNKGGSAAKDAKETQGTQRTTPGASATPASGGQSPGTPVDKGSRSRAATLREPQGDSHAQTLYTYLEELHDFLQNEYADCFNLQERVPASELAAVREHIKYEVHSLLATLVRNRPPNKLISVIIRPYEAICNEASKDWSYHKITWLKTLPEVIGNLGKYKTGNFYTPLIKTLIYHDFNCTKFKNWLVDAIYEDVDKKEGLFQKVERLSFHYKELGKLLVKGGSYIVGVPTVKDDVRNNIANELRHLESTHQLQLVTPVHFREKAQVAGRKSQVSSYKEEGHQPETGASGQVDPETVIDPETSSGQARDNESGIYFGLSVEELGLLTYAQKQTGMIRNKHLTKVAAFYAKHCHTIGRDQFSEVNLYNCFSRKDPKVLESLDSKLVDVLNLIRKWRRR